MKEWGTTEEEIKILAYYMAIAVKNMAKKKRVQSSQTKQSA